MSLKVRVSLSSKLDFFRTLKVRGFAWEPYLDLIKSFQVRQSVARLRTSSHQLNIETGRYHNIPRQMRQCEFCLSQMQSTRPIEDEIHMLYKCKLVEELRRNVLPRLTTLLHTKCGISANRFIIASMLPPPTIKISHKDAVEVATACGNYIHKIYGAVLTIKKKSA